MSPLIRRRRHIDPAVEARVAAALRPGVVTQQSEEFRATLRDTLLRDYDRATAPVKTPRPEMHAPAEAATAAPALIALGEGILASHIDHLDEVEASAASAKIEQIVARHATRA